LDCATDAILYDQPLTIEITPPAAWDVAKIEVKDTAGSPLKDEIVESANGRLLRLEVPPRTSSYSILTSP
jgi:hypothetical protein